MNKLETDFLLGESRNPPVQGLEKSVATLNYIEKQLGPESNNGPVITETDSWILKGRIWPVSYKQLSVSCKQI